MAGQNYYLIPALPPLGELGSAPPLGLKQMLDHVAPAHNVRAATEALFLSDDLLMREAVLAGEVSDAMPSVLTAGQLSNDQPLPAYLTSDRAAGRARRIAADQTWEAYFRHAASVARTSRNGLLGAWVACEVATRNALVERRAQTLQLEPSDYIVAADLGADDVDLTTVLNEWASAPDPLVGMQVLDRARWRWLTDHDRWFSFDDDELTAYAAKLMVLQRWHRLASEAERQPAQVAAGPG